MSKLTSHTFKNHLNLIQSLPPYPFDYNYLMWVLQEYHSPRDKVSQMIKKGEIIRIKKGLYTLPPEFGGIIDRKLIANLIYGPSYISLDFALQYWGLIPERVEEVTCISNKRNKFFNTSLGSFSYKYRHNSKFYPGILLQRDQYSGYSDSAGFWPAFFIASKEKALCDKIALISEIKNTEDLENYLEADLRIDIEDLSSLNLQMLKQIEQAYKKKSVTLFFRFCKNISKELK